MISAAFPGRFRIIKVLVVLSVYGVLAGLGTAQTNTAQTPETQEAPLAIKSGYGVNGLVLWLAADSGVTIDNKGGVTALADKTGNFILTPNDSDQEPAYVVNGLNDRPVLRFNGNQSLYSPDNFGTALNHAMTIIVVAMTTDCSVQNEEFPLYLGQNATPNANRALAYLNGKEFFDGQFVGFIGEPVIKNRFFMVGASIDSTLTRTTFYRNGMQTMVTGLCDGNGNATFKDLTEGVTMGAATDPVAGWKGDIAEELVYDHQLNPAEMQSLWSYLSTKYGLHQVNVIPSGNDPVTKS